MRLSKQRNMNSASALSIRPEPLSTMPRQRTRRKWAHLTRSATLSKNGSLTKLTDGKRRRESLTMRYDRRKDEKLRAWAVYRPGLEQ